MSEYVIIYAYRLINIAFQIIAYLYTYNFHNFIHTNHFVYKSYVMYNIST